MNQPSIPPLISEAKPLIVQFKLSRWDVLQCRLRAIMHTRSVIVLLIGLSAVFPLIHSFGSETQGESIVFRIFYFLIYFLFMLGFMAVAQVVVHFLMMLLQKNRGVVGLHEIEIREDGLLERTDVNESLHRWSGFYKFVTTKRFLIVFITDNIVHYIPLRCFASGQEAKHFQNEVLRLGNAGKQKH